MHKPLFRIAAGSVAAVGGLLIASAMPAGAATAVLASTTPICTTAPGDPPTTLCQPQPGATTPVTFTITSVGTLSIAVPQTTVSLGSEAAPGAVAGTVLTSGTSTGGTPFGAVTVIDNRSLDPADWTATVSCSNFTIAATPQDMIPATDATYDTNGVSAAGAGFAPGDIADVTFGAAPLALTTGAQTVVSEANYDGDNGATWSPTIAVTIPVHAVVGVYTGTVTHSVS